LKIEPRNKPAQELRQQVEAKEGQRK
jgi:hypothetical protein